MQTHKGANWDSYCIIFVRTKIREQCIKESFPFWLQVKIVVLARTVLKVESLVECLDQNISYS